MHRLSWREWWGLAFGSGSNGEEMVVERWQLRGSQEYDHRRRAAAKTISQPDAGDGRRTAYARASFSRRCVCLELESQIEDNSEQRCCAFPQTDHRGLRKLDSR